MSSVNYNSIWTSKQKTTYENLLKECCGNPPDMPLSSSLRDDVERFSANMSSVNYNSIWTSKQKTTYENLLKECCGNPPDMPLSSSLRDDVESMTPGARSELVACMKHGCSPLFIACERRNTNIVQYLLYKCGANLEQLGEYDCFKSGMDFVTPLWYAAATGHLAMVRVLADAGADLNAVSERNCTPLLVACNKRRINVVRFLVDRGADIRCTDRKGKTCLIKLLDYVSICLLLIEKGIDVNACSRNGKAALHVSVMRKNMAATALLLYHGADPHILLPNGSDVLQLACLLGDTPMVNLLTRQVRYPHERLADMYDLLAATLLLKHDNVEGALSQWRQSLTLREKHTLPKRPEMVPHVGLQFAREFCNKDELAAAETDGDALKIQALLVYERLLDRCMHSRFCDLVTSYGLRYSRNMKYQRCINIWFWALEVYLRNSILGENMRITTSNLIWLFKNALAGRIENLNDPIPRIEDVFQAFSLLADSVSVWRGSLDVQERQAKESAFDSVLMCVTYLMHFLFSLLEKEKNKKEGQKWEQLLHKKLCWLVAQDLRTIASEDTLLHLCVSLEYTSNLTIYSHNEVPDQSNVQSLRCVRALLAAGAEVNSRNIMGYSPLHLIAYHIGTCRCELNYKIVLELLEAGAHIDQPDILGTISADLLDSRRIPLLRYQTLQCLAANVLVRHGVKLDPGVLPKQIIQFLQLHE